MYIYIYVCVYIYIHRIFGKNVFEEMPSQTFFSIFFAFFIKQVSSGYDQHSHGKSTHL